MAGTVAHWQAAYAPGSWFVVCGPTSLVVVDPSTDPDRLAELWRAVVGSHTMAELAARLAAMLPAAPAGFAALFWSSDGMRSLVHGGVSLTDPESGAALADAKGVVTWNENRLSTTTRIQLELPDTAGTTAGPYLPLVVGVAQTSSVLLDARAEAVVLSPQQVESVGSSGRAAGGPGAAPSMPTAPTQEARQVGGPGSAHPAGEPPEAGQGQRDRWDSSPTLEEPTIGIPDEADGAKEPAEIEPAGAPYVPAGGRADEAVTEAMPVSAAGASVLVVHCPRHHPNPPNSPSCWLCGAPLAGRPADLAPQPLLARLRSVDGTVVDLDRAVLIGRAPDEAHSSALLPRLMTVANPGQDISRTHVQVEPVEWQVIVTDLRSTNGTSVLSADAPTLRRRLEPAQPTPVPIGSVLELGDGVSVLIDFPT